MYENKNISGLGKIKVSFLAPVYNKESWVSETIESILGQSLKDFEVIFVNDGSTDETANIIRWHMAQDKRIKLFNMEENVGLGMAWNTGTKLVNSDIILVASGDDVWHKDRAKITWEYFHKHKDKDVFYGSFYFCDYKLKQLEYKEAVPFNKKKLMETLPNGRPNQYIGHFVMAYRKKIALKVPYRKDLKVGIDYPFLVDLAEYGARFGHTNKALGWARILKSGVSLSRGDEVEKANKL